MTRNFLTCVSVIALAGCATQQRVTTPPAAVQEQVISLGAIETTTSGACFAQTAEQTETLQEDVVVEVVPAIKDRNGVVTSPAVFRNVTRPRTVITGAGTRFETVCPQLLSEAFVTTLQRALQTRQAYSGAVNGQYDAATGIAVQRFQRAAGVDSPYLSVATARQLGVLAVARNDT